MSRSHWWCEWCGDTVRAHDQFCGRTCAIEWMRDVGGYEWLLQLAELQSNRAQLVAQPTRTTVPRFGESPQLRIDRMLLGLGGVL